MAGDLGQSETSAIERRAREKLDFIIGWLVETNFPFDWHYAEPLPAWFRDELAVRWSAMDRVSVGEVDWAMRQEQRWEDGDA